MNLQQEFKAITLFTPAGDLVYCIDPSRKNRWHSHLCQRLQNILNLPEPPNFLVPAYTATIDCWRDSATQELKILGEIYPPVKRYRYLLNGIFRLPNLTWHIVPWQTETCDPFIIETYRDRFPQLWQHHNLIIPWQEEIDNEQSVAANQTSLILNPTTYVLKLFITSNNPHTQKILEHLHKVLEEKLSSPYTLKVIDVSQEPEQAEKDQITAIPTLIRVAPQPLKKIVGELDNFDRVLQIIAS